MDLHMSKYARFERSPNSVGTVAANLLSPDVSETIPTAEEAFNQKPNKG